MTKQPHQTNKRGRAVRPGGVVAPQGSPSPQPSSRTRADGTPGALGPGPLYELPSLTSTGCECLFDSGVWEQVLPDNSWWTRPCGVGTAVIARTPHGWVPVIDLGGYPRQRMWLRPPKQEPYAAPIQAMAWWEDHVESFGGWTTEKEQTK